MTFVILGLTPSLPPPILKKDDKLFFIFFLVLDHIWVTIGKTNLPLEKCKKFWLKCLKMAKQGGTHPIFTQR